MPTETPKTVRKRGPGRPFTKGRSGNPGGRPKLEGEIRELAQRHGPDALERLVKLMKSDNERVAVIAAQAVLDRAYGKPLQGIDVKGSLPAAGVLQVEFVKAAT